MANDVIGWLAGLSVRSGRVAWRLRDPSGAPVALEVEYSDEVVSVVVEAPGRGRLAIQGGRAVWTAADGRVVTGGAVPAGALEPLRAGVPLDPRNGLDLVRRAVAGPELGGALEWLGAFATGVTVLVIPGISAFGVDLPRLEVGGITLPRMRASVSIRNLAIDLGTATVGFELRIHEARAAAGEALVVKAGKHTLRLDEAEFRLASDVVYSLGDGLGTAAIDWLFAAGGPLSAALVDAGPARISVSSHAVTLTANGLAFDLGASTELRTGRAVLMADTANVETTNLKLGPVAAQRIQGDARNVEIALEAAPSGVRARLKMAEGDLAAHSAALLDFPSKAPVDFDPAVPITVQARGLEVTAPGPAAQQGVVNVEAQILPADVVLSGLELKLVSTAKIRAELALNGVDARLGAMLKFEHAQIVVADAEAPIDLYDAFAKHSEVNPGAIVSPARTILKSQAIDELSVRVKFPTLTPFPGRDIAIPLGSADALKTLVGLIEASAPGTPGLAQLKDGLDFIARMSNAGHLVGVLGDVLGLFSVRVDGIDLLLGLDEVTVSVDDKRSKDRTLSFRITSGFTGFGVRVRYSWPSPTWDDWGRREDGDEDFWIRFKVGMPDLVLDTRFQYDATAKKLEIVGVGAFLDILPELKPAPEIIQKFALSYYGVSEVIDAIIDAVNLRLPTGLPDTWDVSDFSINRSASDKVDGLTINLRAYSATFDTL